jgi:hypothetical protein
MWKSILPTQAASEKEKKKERENKKRRGKSG